MEDPELAGGIIDHSSGDDGNCNVFYGGGLSGDSTLCMYFNRVNS